MTNKEYRARLEEHFQFNGWDMMNRQETSAQYHGYKAAIKSGARPLADCNFRAFEKPFNGGVACVSYDTIVCMYDENGAFLKLWEGFSKTTLKHINAFRHAHGDKLISKREWIELNTANI